MAMIVERKVPHFLPEPHSAGVASEDEMQMRSYCQVIALTMRSLDPIVKMPCDFSAGAQTATLLSTYTGLVKGISGSRWVKTNGPSVQPVCEDE